MTNSFDTDRGAAELRQPGRFDQSRLARGLFNTIPIVLAGTMAIGLNVTGPVQSVDQRRDKPRSSPSELGKNIRQAFTAAARAATNPLAAPVSAAAMSVASAAPATYMVAAGDTVSGIAGRFGLATASVLALNGLGWKSIIFAGQTLKLTASGAVPAVKVTAQKATTRYTIQTGDTIGGIAAKLGLSTQVLLSANGLGWSSIIYPGQTIAIPGSATVASVAPASQVRIVETSSVTPATNAPATYTIVSGDTMAGIAAKFALSTQVLLSANGLGWSRIIYPGQTITIPGSATVASVAPASQVRIVETSSVTPATNAPVTYTIASGDTVAGIAARFGVSSQAILTANNLTWSSIIYSGHTIVIPSAVPNIPSSPSAIVPMSTEMAANARTIVAVGRSLGVSDYGLVIALAAAAQESGLRNLDFGDRDSLGLFQQRPSAGWGTPAQIMQPSYAAELFFGGPHNPNLGNTLGLLDIPGWQSMSVTNAAQAVQLSGYPTAYAKWEGSARSWLSSLN